MTIIDLVARTFAYYLPAYFVNGGILFVYSMFEGGIPVSVKWFGPHRTFDALLFAVLCGGSTGLLVSNLTLGVFLGAGAWLGALSSSFLKRRLGIKPGGKAPVLDQLDFVVGATSLGCLVEPPKLEYFLIIVFATIFIHRAANMLAYWAGLKDVPY
jgi:CDP-2,3-bis-(O-geranylgeranyl)-sn-glycerol synthase